MDFERISKANYERALLWHPGGLKEWSVADWACAMAGEAGEVRNAIKKLKRAEQHLVQAAGPQTVDEAKQKVGLELGDTYIYLNLLALRIGTGLRACIEAVEREKVNFEPDDVAADTTAGLGCQLMEVVGECCSVMTMAEFYDQQGTLSHESDGIYQRSIGRVFLALDELATALGLSLETCVVQTFNRVSEREGFPQRLEMPLKAAA